MPMNEIPGLGARLSMAWRVLTDAVFAGRVTQALASPPETKPALPPAATPPPSPELPEASALFLLAALQREGRLVDFVQQEVAGFSDAEVGGAARVIHAGCRQALKQYFSFEAVLPNAEGDKVQIPPGFDSREIQLTGNVAGKPPFQGVLKHHGWRATQDRKSVV